MKKLLIICQAVDQDSSTLGFFIEWLKEFSRQCGEVRVIGQSVGRYELPANVRVASMGKERGLPKIIQLWNLWKLAWRWLPEVDGVFTHLSPEFALAVWPIAVVRRKPVALWYAHRQDSLQLRLAAASSDVVATIAEGSFPFRTKKLRAMGHGIPTEKFAPAGATVREPKLLSVGRITRIKRLDLVIRSLADVRRRGIQAALTLVGEPVTADDREYLDELRNLAGSLGVSAAVEFRGAARYDELPAVYRAHALHVNLAPTGAPDKAVLEAMACGLAVVVTNRTFQDILAADAGHCLADPDPKAIAGKIFDLLRRSDENLRRRLRTTVVERHSLKRLITSILDAYVQH